MFGYYNNQSLRKLVVGFGSLFSNIYVEHKSSGNDLRIEVPLQYASQEKFIQRLLNPSSITDGTRIETQLPRMSFILNNINPDPSRRRTRFASSISLGSNCGENGTSVQFENPVNVGFSLFVYTRHIDDMLQIIEQIFPYFTPDHIITMDLIGNGSEINIPLTLISNNITDRYDGDFNSRRIHIASLNFIAKSYIYGPLNNIQTITGYCGYVSLGGLTSSFNYNTPTQPSPPYNLSVIGTGYHNVTLRWFDSSDIEDGFKIFYR